jgi:hypothetical protein
MTLVKRARRNSQRGVAMIMALLAVLLLAIIGMAFMSMTMTEHSANNNYKDSQKAYFASRAGLENVRALLWTNPNFQAQVSALTMPTALGNTGVVYALNPTGAEVVDPTGSYLDDELCHEQFGGVGAGGLGLSAGTAGAPCGTGGAAELMPGPGYYQPANVNAGAILNSGTTSALPFKWVRITNKQNFMPSTGAPGVGVMVDGSNAATAAAATKIQQVCWDGNKEVAALSCAAWNLANPSDQANPVWLLTSLAITPGQSRRMTQMEVAFTPPIYPVAAVTAQAPVTTVGSSLTVNGYDNCTCNPATGISRTTGLACPKGGPYAIASGGAINSNGNPTLVSGESTPTETLNPWPYDVPKIISNFLNDGPVNVAQGPNSVTSCSGTPNFNAIPPIYANCSNITGSKSGAQSFGTYPTGLPDNPTNNGPQMTYIPGSVSLHANVTGSGVLIIDGDLDVHGGLSWYGLILVRGRINFTGGGSQAVNMYGALLAGEDVNAQDIPIGDKVGGSFSFQYDTCALKQSAPPGPPKLLATHELMY